MGKSLQSLHARIEKQSKGTHEGEREGWMEESQSEGEREKEQSLSADARKRGGEGKREREESVAGTQTVTMGRSEGQRGRGHMLCEHMCSASIHKLYTNDDKHTQASRISSGEAAAQCIAHLLSDRCITDEVACILKEADACIRGLLEVVLVNGMVFPGCTHTHTRCREEER